jgi:superfamily I DNA/RNA helicase
LALNAKFYYLIGDLYQNIFAYSGTSAKELITMLVDRRPVEEMTLTVNFRSDVNIVENSNNFTELKAIPNSSLSGSIENNIITDIDSLISILDTRSEVAILVRTNAVITQLEKKLLSIRYPMNYINYFKDKELEELKNDKLNPILSKKWSVLSPFYSSKSELIAFIKSNKTSRKFITTIHKSKGREFDCCVVVNSIAPTILLENGYNLPKKEFKKISFDEQEKNDLEPRNIHYVAVTRPKHELFYMLWGNV